MKLCNKWIGFKIVCCNICMNQNHLFHTPCSISCYTDQNEPHVSYFLILLKINQKKKKKKKSHKPSTYSSPTPPTTNLRPTSLTWAHRRCQLQSQPLGLDRSESNLNAHHIYHHFWLSLVPYSLPDHHHYLHLLLVFLQLTPQGAQLEYNTKKILIW